MKKDASFFKNNAKLWQERHGELPPSENQWEFCLTGHQELNLKKNNLYLHSEQNIEAEVRQWLSLFDPSNVEWLLVYGVGLGYHYLGLAEWLHYDPHRRVIFVEDDPSVLNAFLETDAAEKLLQDPQADVVFCRVDEQLYENLKDLIQSFLFRPKHLGALGSYFMHKRPVFDHFAFLFRYFLEIQEGTTAEYLTKGISFFQNYYNNLLNLDASKNGTAFVDQFKGVPAIVCGAGPSLRKNIETLKTLKNKALIFAGGTAMNALNVFGVLPHFGCGVDPFSFHLSRILSNIGFETPFFFRTRMNSNAVSLLQGSHIYLPGAIGYPIGEWFDNQLGYPPFELDDGSNVINLTLSLARKLGCNPILTVGLDLAYSDGLSYPPGLKAHGIDDPRKQFITKGESEELLLVKDIKGEPVYTLMKWLIESSWYAAFASYFPDVTLINCTEGGIGFHGIQNMSLAEAAENYLKSDLDLEGKMAKVLNSKAAMEAPSHEKIQEILCELTASLQRCLEILSSSDPEPQIDAKLKEETAYQAILAPFDKVYCFFMETKEKSPHLLSTIQKSLQGRIPYLKELCVDNLKAIKEALELKVKRKAALSIAQKVPEIPKVIHMECRVEGNQFYIGEACYPLEHAERKKDAESETFYRHGLLHGPSTYNYSSGKILSQVWYVEGKKEGVAVCYSESGQLLSKKQFKRDLEEGTHLFYYPDGSLKSLISYHSGLLDGPVFLYYSNGSLMRSSYFSAGKREGIDTIYTPQKTPLFQAQYMNDIPVGSSKVWDLEGRLRKEVIYTTSGKVLDSHEWDGDGKETSKSRIPDYFDTVTKDTLQLQNAFSGMNKSLQGVAEVLKENLSSDAKLELENDISELNERILGLQEVGEKLMKASGMDEQKKEFIWKTPGNEKRIHEILQGMTSPMQEALLKLQHKLRDLIQPDEGDKKNKGNE